MAKEMAKKTTKQTTNEVITLSWINKSPEKLYLPRDFGLDHYEEKAVNYFEPYIGGGEISLVDFTSLFGGFEKKYFDSLPELEADSIKTALPLDRRLSCILLAYTT